MDEEILRQALGGLQRCVGQTPSAGQYVFSTLDLSPPLPTESPRAKVRDLSSLAKFTELRKIRISSQCVADLSPIGRLPFLAELQADHNELDMSIENCGARWCKEDNGETAWSSGDRFIGSVLEVVDLSYNKICGPIGDHSKHRFLRNLDLSNNVLGTLGPGLSKLENLKTLNISNNGLKLIERGNLPTSLTSLDVSSNGLKQIKFVGNLLMLELVNLDSNRISVLSSLANCSSLRTVSARNNLLSEFKCAEDLEENEHLQELFITGNPLFAVDFVRLRVIAILQQLRELDGVAVDATDKVKSEVLTGSEHPQREETWKEMVGSPFVDMVPAFHENSEEDALKINEAMKLASEEAVQDVIRQATPR
jgi:hypothetical protein